VATTPRRTLPAFGFAADLLRQPAPELPATRESLIQEEVAGKGPVEEMPDAGERWLADDLDGPGRVFDFADRLSARVEERKAAGPKPRLETCLTFGLGSETFAMPVEPVQQVVRISTITRVPHAPHPIRGVTNLRGRVIPVIDLRVRVGLPAAEIDRSSRIIAVGSRGRVIGLLVDTVFQVMHLDLNQIQRPPEDVMTMQSDYIAGVYHHGPHLLLLLDVDRALIIREAGAA
jgi:purine-binding chemotaxis protein CheW